MECVCRVQLVPLLIYAIIVRVYLALSPTLTRNNNERQEHASAYINHASYGNSLGTRLCVRLVITNSLLKRNLTLSQPSARHGVAGVQ